MAEIFALASGVFAIWWFAAWIACALFAGHLAELKGRCVACWLLGGLLFGPLALIAAAGMPDCRKRLGEPRPETHVTCPECIGFVHQEARKCQYCGTRLVPASAISGGGAPSDGSTWKERVRSPEVKVGVVVFILLIAAVFWINKGSDPPAPSPPAVGQR